MEKKERKSAAVRRALQALEREGRLTPDDVIASARSQKSPLHEYFEWDDAKAAAAHRLEQARTLIRSVQITVTVDQDRLISAPVYVRDPAVPDGEQGYVSLPSIRESPAAAQAALHIELVRVEGLLERAENVADVVGMKPEVGELRSRARKLRQRVQPQA